MKLECHRDNWGLSGQRGGGMPLGTPPLHHWRSWSKKYAPALYRAWKERYEKLNREKEHHASRSQHV